MVAKALTFEFHLLTLEEIYAEATPDLSPLGPTDPMWLAIIEADLRIRTSEEVFFDEPGFPLADLVWQLRGWVEQSLQEGIRFAFDGSLHVEEEGVLTFGREAAGWRLRSIWERVPGGVCVEAGPFEQGVRLFVEEAEAALRAQWGVEACGLGTVK